MAGGRLLQKVLGRIAGAEELLDVLAQVGVLTTRAIEKAGALFRRKIERVIEELLDLSPALDRGATHAVLAQGMPGSGRDSVELSVEPCLCLDPVASNGSGRDSERGRCLVLRETAEVAALHHARQSLVEPGQASERSVQSQ